MTISDTIKNIALTYIKRVHISIVHDDRKYYITSRFVGKNGSESESKVYDVVGDKMPPIMVKYLRGIQKKHPYSYVSTILSTINAGAIHACDEEAYQKMHIETDSIVKVCVDKSWSAYSSVYAIDEVKHFYEDAGGIDYIFPQEIIVKHLLSDEVVEGQCIYIMTAGSFAVVTVFSENGLLYSAHFIYKEEEEAMGLEDEIDEMDEVSDMIEETQKDSDEIEEVLQLEDIDDNDLFDGGLEDLDELEDIESPEFDDIDTLEEPEDDLALEEEETIEDAIGLSKKDQLLCEFLHNSIEDFYKNSFYKSEFIQRAKIFDGCHGDQSTGEVLNRYIKDELMLESEIEKIDLGDVLCDISLMESDAV